MKSGFVNIFGKPNAGKSTLLNALMGEKMAIVSHKVQTTRHRIKAILTEKDYQIIFSDTPGIIEPKYKLHEKMMQAVKGSLEDADVALLITDVRENTDDSHAIFAALKLKAPAIVILNKADTVNDEQLKTTSKFFAAQPYCKEVVAVSALQKTGIEELIKTILTYLPEGQPFYEGDDLSDMPTKFFVGEMIREKIFLLYGEEIPYHATVLVQEFKEKYLFTYHFADKKLGRHIAQVIAFVKRLSFGQVSEDGFYQFLNARFLQGRYGNYFFAIRLSRKKLDRKSVV